MQDGVQQRGQPVEDGGGVDGRGRAVEPALDGQMGAGQPVVKGGLGLPQIDPGVVEELVDPVLAQHASAAHPAFALLLVDTADLVADPVQKSRGEADQGDDSAGRVRQPSRTASPRTRSRLCAWPIR